MSAPTQEDVNQLLALFAARNYPELEKLAQAMLARAPEFGFGWKALGVAQKLQGRDSLYAARQAVQFLPGDVEALLNLGVAQREHGLLEEAVASYEQALALNRNAPEAYSNLANVLADLGRLDEAAAHCRQAIAIAPGHAMAWVNLGYVLQRLGRAQEAIEAGRQAIALVPGNASAHNNLANALSDAGAMQEAESAYRRALQLDPRYAFAWVSLAALMSKTGRSAEAYAASRTAIELAPDLAEAHNNLADAAKELQQFDIALASYARALALKPGHAQAHYNLSLLLLQLGRYEEAWPHHEWRTDPQRGKSAVRPATLDSPIWRGESLERKHIVLCHEQGYGDTIQFVRFAPLLKRRGAARISLLCPPELAPLMARATGIDQVFVSHQDIQAHDYHVLTMSVPHRLASSLDTLPARLPYLQPETELVRQWRDALPEGGPRVGLAWKGSTHHQNDAHRSLPHLETLAPLWQTAGVRFVSLQKGQGEDEAKAAPPGQPLTALGHRVTDFATMGAIIGQLDLVIAVDTAVAHLAGALGKPCWVMLPARGTDWRWLRGRSDSPWYPATMRLYRQAQAGDWHPLVEQIAADLESFARTQR